MLILLLANLLLFCYDLYRCKADTNERCTQNFQYNERNTHFIWESKLNESDIAPNEKWFAINYANQNPSREKIIVNNHVQSASIYKIEKNILLSALATDFLFFEKNRLLKDEKFQIIDKDFNQFLNNTILMKSFFDDFYDIDLESNKRKIAIMNNVYTNKFGLIVDSNNCRNALRNGGCYHMGNPKFFKLTNGKKYDSVISLASGASGTWHFPMVYIKLCNY